MLEPKPTIVLFDMDGTTVRHLDPRVLAMLEKADDIAHKGAKFFSKLLRRKIDAPLLVEHRDGKRPKVLVQRAMHKIRRRPIDQIVEPCPGIYSILDLLQDKQIRMAIISNGLGKGYGYDILQKFDLAKYYEARIFREDIRRPKPYPDPILQALEAMQPKITAQDVIWYFGDRRKDILAALAARAHLPCPIIPFAYNLHAAIAVLEHNIGTDHIIMAWPDFEPKLRRVLETQN